jgi:hypothetical protein
MTEKQINELNERSDRIHKIYHEFCDYMKQWCHDDAGDFNPHEMGGYEIMKIIEEYVELHPDIKIAYCDDAIFDSSLLVFIPHVDMGYTVWFIPQGYGEMSEFFLYPNHLEYLIEVLNEIKNKCKDFRLL